MKKFYLTCLLISSALISNAQFGNNRSFELGIGSGVTNYFGDLGNERILQTTSTRPGCDITIRNFTGNSALTGNFYNPLSFEARISWHRIGYDESKPIGDRKGFDLRNYGRGISFQNDLFGFSTHITYTVYPNRHMPLHKQGAAMFFFTGAGVYYGKPKADLFRGDISLNNRYYFWLDGTTRNYPQSDGMQGAIIKKDGTYETDLTKWSTEKGQGNGEQVSNKKYKNTHVAIPCGFGFRFGLSKALTLSAEFGYYYFFTDFLDDVSDAYISYEDLNKLYPNDPEKQKLALYISDPTGYGTNGYPGPATSIRGNPKRNDTYSYANLELAYKFEFRGEKVRFFGKR
ncbi:MAG: hypothetical protein ABI855_06775 [Bacteroidota bacterium]